MPEFYIVLWFELLSSLLYIYTYLIVLVFWRRKITRQKSSGKQKQYAYQGLRQILM